MTAAGLQDACLARRDDRGAEIDAGYRTSGSLRQIAREAGDAGGAVEAFLDAPGDDAPHAGTPGRAADDQCRVAGIRLRFGRTHGSVEHRGLDLLALAVHGVEC